ncbi:hypothetical protein QBC34DRAFT_406286 [Podospora aff. communis PSN243]|uniref:Uncharacterized protein n=1 Tax=Podospora aff. communis PSN243 TaxID=3040156 RepID=A0AAV9GN05_9PEZI|nr:hypothetical protein QBC34DRAFT_406286 [Podospora aff. communis PSN243]
MIPRITPRVRTLLPTGTRQSRFYATGGPGEKGAEQRAGTANSVPIWVVIGGATLAVGGIWATMFGNPHKVADVATESDPDAVKHMKPNHGTLKR